MTVLSDNSISEKRPATGSQSAGPIDINYSLASYEYSFAIIWTSLIGLRAGALITSDSSYTRLAITRSDFVTENAIFPMQVGSKIASTHSSKPYTVPILTGPTLTTTSDRDYSLYDLSSGILNPVDYIELTSTGLHIHVDPFSPSDTDDEKQEAFVEFKTEGLVVFLFA